jgi:hypothetical protein
VIGELLAGIAAQAGLGRIKAAVRPNPYAPDLPNQADRAAAQSGYGLRPGTSGLAGSEAEFYTDAQGRSSLGYLGIVQDVPSRAMPPSTFVAGDPGADRADPTVLADFYRGPVGLELVWGVNQRGSPHTITARINEPTAKTPLPRAVVAGRLEDNARPDPFDSAWDD